MAKNAVLEAWKAKQAQIQDAINAKLEKGTKLTDEEVLAYEVTDEDVELLELLDLAVDGSNSGLSLQDFLGTPQAQVLIPKILIKGMRKAADPLYLASTFYKKIQLKQGNAIEFPSIGVMRAYDVAEGQEIPQETIDWQLHKGNMIKVGKSGVRIQVSDELIKDSEWDIVGMLLSEAGRAMARHKEQKAFVEWLKHGHTVFDNDLYKMDPVMYKEAATTGLDYEGNYNGTMSIDDFLDIVIAVYNNEYTPTDLIMHPLVWTVFARNGLTGGFTAPFDRESKRETATSGIEVGPGSIQGRLPFAFKANLSPFAPIDKRNKKFDIFVVDRNNVGVEIVKDALKTDEFVDPARDIKNVKLIERYGFGTYNEGRAICSAKAISMAKSYPMPERVKNID